MNNLSKLSLFFLAVGILVIAAKRSEESGKEIAPTTVEAWSDRALQVESQWASGEYRPEYRIRLDRAYEEASDVKRPNIKLILAPTSSSGTQTNVGRAISISCNGDELISTSIGLASQDMRIQFSCFDKRYRVRFIDPTSA
ncbi:hypothetical protein ACK3BE_33425 (plasmid) [Pseudomonas mandelii]|uniref:hypothetical protein n=1 Tax=Pseudomonas mandelii TaxID=75612 RepID=UPI00398CC047